MPRPIRATVSRAALAHNLAVVRRHAPGARVWAVVKADAYGHGLVRALPGLAAADGLALLDFDAAVRLREAGYGGPVLLLEGCFGPADFALARAYDLAVVIHSAAQLATLEREPSGAPLSVYLKFNSGMNRLGFDAPSLRAAYQRLERLPQVAGITLMTHFAQADRDGGIADPLARFDAACAGLPGPRSLSNSAAIMGHGALGGEWVRPGIILYGATPVAERPAASYGVRPVMRLESELISVQEIAVGAAVGYGGRFVAQRPTRLGVVACGYADGYPRSAADGTPVAVAGQIVPLVGRVSMDMITVDVTDLPEARVGSPVELWGDIVPVDDVARAAGTVGYELLCALAPRVPVVTD